MNKMKLNLIFGNMNGRVSTIHYANAYYKLVVSKIGDRITFFKVAPLDENLPKLYLPKDKYESIHKKLNIDLPFQITIGSGDAKNLIDAITIATETAKQIEEVINL